MTRDSLPPDWEPLYTGPSLVKLPTIFPPDAPMVSWVDGIEVTYQGGPDYWCKYGFYHPVGLARVCNGYAYHERG